MGCGKSTPAPPPEPAAAQPAQPDKPQKKPINKDAKFQWKDSKGWNNYDNGTDAKLKQAFLVGRPNASFKIKTHTGKIEQYSFNFDKGRMQQKNEATSNQRDMRAPMGMSAPPGGPVLPDGDFIVVTLRADQVGQSQIQIPNPHNPGSTISVSIPKKAKKGAKIAVPIPGKDQGVEEVAKKQQGMSTGSKVATGLGISVVAGAAVVGGVILGDHLAGGTLAQDVADMAVDGADAVADAAPDILEDAGDFAEDVGDWLGDAAEDVGEWICSVF